MKTTLHLFLISTVFAATSTLAFAQDTEKLVRMKSPEGKYIIIGVNGVTLLGGTADNYKQVFTIIDANGGELADGDEVQVRTNAGGTKPSFWRVKEGEFGRGREPFTFKLKKSDDRFVFQTADDRYVGAPDGRVITLVDKEEAALQVEFVTASAEEAKPGFE